MIFDYITVEESQALNFYKVPKLLFDPYFRELSTDAKLLYGLMLDRAGLSRANEWFDDEGRVYIIYTIESIMQDLDLGKNKAINIIKELSKIGLVESIRRGLGKPNIIYVKSLISLPKEEYQGKVRTEEEYNDKVMTEDENIVEEINDSYLEELDDDFEKFETNDSRSLESKPQEVYKTNFKRFKKQTSRSLKNKLQEVYKTNSNKTELNKTELNKTNLSINHTNYDRNGWIDRIKKQVDYGEIGMSVSSFDPDGVYMRQIDEFIELMAEVNLMDDNHMLKINGLSLTVEAIKERFSKITGDMLMAAFDKLQEVTYEIVNPRNYLLTMLYNLPVTFSAKITNEVVTKFFLEPWEPEPW